MATYLVTGGCGYLGSRLVGRLEEQGHYVRVLDNLSHGVSLSAADCIEMNIGDVTQLKTVEHFMDGVDACFHLADLSEYPRTGIPEKDIKCGLTGAFNVFSAARKSCTKVVYVSSFMVYGDNADLPLSENSEPCPLTPYAADKRALELHAKVASVMHHIPTVGLRLFNVYGECYPHERARNDVVSDFVRSALEGKPIAIPGNGLHARDFIHVDDALNAILAAMAYEAHVPEIFNVCSGQGCTLKELAERVNRQTHQDVPVLYKPSNSFDGLDAAGSSDIIDCFEAIGCPKKTRRKLGAYAQIPLAEGVQRLVNFYREELNAKSENGQETLADNGLSENDGLTIGGAIQSILPQERWV